MLRKMMSILLWKIAGPNRETFARVLMLVQVKLCGHLAQVFLRAECPSCHQPAFLKHRRELGALAVAGEINCPPTSSFLVHQLTPEEWNLTLLCQLSN